MHDIDLTIFYQVMNEVIFAPYVLTLLMKKRSLYKKNSRTIITKLCSSFNLFILEFIQRFT